MAVRRSCGVRYLEGELEEMIDKESDDDDAGPDLVSSRKGCAEVMSHSIGLGFCRMVLKLDHRAVIDVDGEGRHQDNATSPNKDRQAVQAHDIGIELMEEDGRVAGYMKDDEDDQYLARYRHEDLSADSGCR